MTKKLTKLNVILFAVMVAVAACYAVYECNDYLIDYLMNGDYRAIVGGQPNINYLIGTFHYLIISLALLIAGIYWNKEQHYPNIYAFAVKCTFVYPAATFIFCALSYDANNIDYHTSFLDCYVIPTIMLCLATVISINYFLCYRQAKDMYEDF